MSNSNSQNGSQSTITAQPLPASEKIHVESQSCPDVRVAMRAIAVSGANAPLTVYDTSGPYTDPRVETDIRKGLRPLRLEWIRTRGDVEESTIESYNGGKNGSGRASDTERFPDASRRPILRAKPGRNVTQMYYAKNGIVTPEM